MIGKVKLDSKRQETVVHEVPLVSLISIFYLQLYFLGFSNIYNYLLLLMGTVDRLDSKRQETVVHKVSLGIPRVSIYNDVQSVTVISTSFSKSRLE